MRRRGALVLALILPLVLGGLPPGEQGAADEGDVPVLPARVHGGPHLEVASPFNYAAIPAGTNVALNVSGTGFTALRYAVDDGPVQPLDPPYEVSTASWPPGMRVLRVEALDDATVVASRTFVFFVDPEATWPPDTVPVDVVLVGFSLPPQDLESRLVSSYPVTRLLGGVEETFDLTFEFQVHAARAGYHQDLLDYLRDKAEFRDDLQAELNLEALLDQRDNGTLRDAFDPLEGWEIDTAWAELYLKEVPPVPTLEPGGYTFTLLNLSALDDPTLDHDHWFVEEVLDPDTRRSQDWWRLEWDNDLNTPMGYPLNVWGGPDHAVFVDPTAYQWYLDWSYVWFQGGNDRAPFGLQYEEVAPAARLGYLADVVNDLVAGLAATLPGPPPTDSGVLIRNYVLSGSLNHSLEDLRWVSSDQALATYLADAFPYKDWIVDTTFDPVASYPDLNEFVDSVTTFEGSRGFIDGLAVWNYLLGNKSQFVGDEPDVLEVLTVNFLYDNRSMRFGAREFTGLGGSGITAIFLKTDRLFDADGARQKGLTSVIAHETGHNLGYGHQFGPNFRADFVNGNMGYFRNDLSYGRFWEDAFHRLSVREKLRDTLTALEAREPLDLEAEFTAFYRDYRRLDLLGAYEELLRIDALLADAVDPTADAGPDRTVPEDALVTLDAGASTDNLRILNYTWDLGDGRRAVVPTPTVETSWTNPGTYEVTLTVTDVAGNAATDGLQVAVLDRTPPSLTILEPSAGSQFAPGEVRVRWEVTDNGPGLQRIEVSLDGGDPVELEGDATELNLTVEGGGLHVVTVAAYDGADNRDLATVSFTVEARLAPSLDLRIVGIAGGAAVALLAVGLYLFRRSRRGRGPPPHA